jgi:hypothetical protein
MNKTNTFSGRLKAAGKTRRSSLYLVAFLDLHGVDMSLCEHEGDIYFEMADDEEQRALTKAFVENKPVPVLQFVASVKKVRSLVFQARKGVSSRPPAASAIKSDPQSADAQT